MLLLLDYDTPKEAAPTALGDYSQLRQKAAQAVRAFKDKTKTPAQFNLARLRNSVYLLRILIEENPGIARDDAELLLSLVLLQAALLDELEVAG